MTPIYCSLTGAEGGARWEENEMSNFIFGPLPQFLFLCAAAVDYIHTDTIQSDLEAPRDLAKGQEGFKLKIERVNQEVTPQLKKGSLVTDGELS